MIHWNSVKLWCSFFRFKWYSTWKKVIFHKYIIELSNLWWIGYVYVAEREKSLLLTDPPVEPISSCRDESGYVPTVGRWGNEWPSWLETEQWEQLTGSGEWPPGHPLPLPSWGSPKSALCVPNVEQYEELASSVELTVQQLLQAHNYNSVGNLIRYVHYYSSSSSWGTTTSIVECLGLLNNILP